PRQTREMGRLLRPPRRRRHRPSGARRRGRPRSPHQPAPPPPPLPPVGRAGYVELRVSRNEPADAPTPDAGSGGDGGVALPRAHLLRPGERGPATHRRSVATLRGEVKRRD